ncbi:signal transduction histidine kinase [Aneurinibacillus soli]|uniref:histidine kinase n=1 Tax=Aneurinibacillus soli TaxID=1500254 RepID=A0A0U4NLN4_9BACL|nr:ATP-binding protein [Aneurinibacillus soli]PYE57065.1 signal transduction histidine kinase [Aneurinibacillus soli]BAU29572.1 Sporulation kinase E [Aneurinibacillus soli]
MLAIDSSYIEACRERCVRKGLDPDIIPVPNLLAAKDLAERKEWYNEILEMTNFFANKLLFFGKHPVVLCVTDSQSAILDMYGDEGILQSVQHIGIVPGAVYREQEMGINTVSLALEHNKPIKILGNEHYHTYLAESACYSVPFCYEGRDGLTGTLSILTTLENATDMYLGILLAVVESVGRELLLRKQNQKLFMLNQILEKQIMASEKFSAVGKLAAGFAHEIRNPLTSISGFIQLLQEKETVSHKDVLYFGIIRSELARINKLVTDFVGVAKPEAQAVSKKDDIKKVLDEMVIFMQSQALLCNVEIVYKAPDIPVVMEFNEMQMKQVVMNLLQNAIEAMPNGGQIVVVLSEEAGFVSIRVQDKGIGMTEDEQQQVLQPFFTTKESGLGLGLSICCRIIENHQGQIEIDSQKGEGTTFHIKLPKR